MAAIHKRKEDFDVGYLIATIGLFIFIFCIVWFFIRLIKRKPKKQPALGMLACFLLIVVGLILTPTPDKEISDTSNIPDSSSKQAEEIKPDTANTAQTVEGDKDSEVQVDSNEEMDKPSEESLLYHVDWDKCSDDLKSSVLNQEFYSYAKDVYVGVDEDRKLITFSAVVGDATAPEIVLDYADTIIRQYNLMANMQDNNIALGSKDYYGGLYDIYDILIGVAPQSKTGNQDEWFIFDAVISGTHKKIKLQKAYT